jgi:hypothetical protein
VTETTPDPLKVWMHQAFFMPGRMISGTKIAPKGQTCVFNANVCTKKLGKIWFGDLNLTKDEGQLKHLGLMPEKRSMSCESMMLASTLKLIPNLKTLLRSMHAMTETTKDDLWLIDFRACGSERDAMIWLRDKRTKAWMKLDGNRTPIRKIANLLVETLNEARA